LLLFHRVILYAMGRISAGSRAMVSRREPVWWTQILNIGSGSHRWAVITKLTRTKKACCPVVHLYFLLSTWYDTSLCDSQLLCRIQP
jgi:hypothetical protein